MRRLLILLAPVLAFALPCAPARALLTPADYGIVPLEPVVDRDVAVMGEPLNFTLRFEVTGVRSPDRDYEVLTALVDEYGHVRASHTFTPDPGTSSWQPGAIVECAEQSMRVPPQIEPEATEPVDQPPIYEGLHHLLLVLRDPASGDFLDISGSGPAGPDPFPDRPTIRDIWVSGAPAVIRSVVVAEDGATAGVRVERRSGEAGPLRCRLLLESPAGRLLWSGAAGVSPASGSSEAVEFALPQDWCGALTLRAELYQGSTCLNWVEKPWHRSAPEGVTVRLERANRVEGEGESRYVPVSLTVQAPAESGVEVRVLADGKPHFSGGPWQMPEGETGLSTVLKVPPHWGRFDFEVKVSGARGCIYAWACVATVVEIRGTQMFVNGEPFILKSVNVHGLHSESRQITSDTMRILKGLGFNNLRADWPPLWQIRLAEELNMTYMPLAPYSCTGTEEVLKRYPIGDPLYGVRRETENFIGMFGEEAGVLLWNSANEVGGEISRMLVSMYPLYRIEDPYCRPVVYANLGDQGERDGMDIVGVNVYAWLGSSPRSMQSLIEQEIAFAHEGGKPVIFTEFNHWWGPVHWIGADAVRDMGEFAVAHGMTGTTLYKSSDVGAHHPGPIAAPEAYGNINTPMADAVAEFNADIVVSLAGAATGPAVVIANRRPFTIEEPRILIVDAASASVAWDSGPLANIPPQGSLSVALTSAPRSILDNFEAGLWVRVEHQTHAGLRCRRQVVAFPELAR